MGTSLYEQYQQEQKPPQSGSLYDQFKAEQAGTPAPTRPRFVSDATSALPRNRPNASGDFQAATANAGQQLKFAGQVAGSHLLNAAQGIPGAEAAEAYAGSKLTGQPYQQALASLRGRIQRDVGDSPIRTVEQVAGTAPLALLKPLQAMGAAKSGALIGGAGQALGADDESALERAGKTVAGAAGGFAVGKALDLGATALGAARTPSPQANMIKRQADRAESAVRLFGAAQTEGEMNGATHAVQQFLQEPEIAQRIQALQQLEQYKNTPADSPEMIRALARSMSDEANALEKGLAVTDPSKPNTLRERIQSLGRQKKRLIDVVSSPSTKPPLTLDVAPEVTEVQPQITPGRETQAGPITGKPLAETTTAPSDPTLRQALRDFPQSSLPPQMQGPGGPAFQLRGQPDKVIPGVRIETPGMRVQTAPAEAEPAMMPSFREASEDFARRSQEMEALRKGMFALQGESGLRRPTPNNIVADNPKTREAFANWVQRGGPKGGPVSPGEIDAARQGILGDLSNAWRYEKQGLRAAPFRRTANAATELLREAPTQGQSTTDLLKQLGLLSLNSPFANGQR